MRTTDSLHWLVHVEFLFNLEFYWLFFTFLFYVFCQIIMLFNGTFIETPNSIMSCSFFKNV